jgi:hypothetical protein
MNADTNVAPLNPFPSIPGSISTSINTTAFIPVVFLIAFVLWLLYSCVAAYHWFRYGHRSWLAVPAIAVHIFVSSFLMLYMMSGLR